MLMAMGLANSIFFLSSKWLTPINQIWIVFVSDRNTVLFRDIDNFWIWDGAQCSHCFAWRPQWRSMSTMRFAAFSVTESLFFFMIGTHEMSAKSIHSLSLRAHQNHDILAVVLSDLRFAAFDMDRPWALHHRYNHFVIIWPYKMTSIWCCLPTSWQTAYFSITNNECTEWNGKSP